MRKVAVWLAGVSVVVAVGSTPVAFAAIPDNDGQETTTRTVVDGDHVKQQINAPKNAQDMATRQESHWPSGKRNLTIVDTDPGRGYANEWQNVIAQWNSANAGITITYSQGAAACDYNGATIAVCYKDLEPGVAGRAWNAWVGGTHNHTTGGYIEIDPEFTDPGTKLNVACHELGHELGLAHPADGSAGPCSGGQVREDEKAELRAIYAHDDNPPAPPAAACADGQDNDGDGKSDHPADPGCDSATDTDETDAPAPPPAAQCADGQDNDGDGKSDHPADPGCDSATDDDETDAPAPPPAAQCADGQDNDGDGKSDHPADPGCDGATDDDESDAPAPAPACSDGADNDGDGKTDHPGDPGCDSTRDGDETDAGAPAPKPACNDGVDNDSDGKTDFPEDPGCKGPFDPSEFGTATCDDGKDNDSDGKTDFPADPGCESLTDNVEKDGAPNAVQCKDGLDNDGDGKVDFADDPGCDSETDIDEADTPTGQPADPWEDCALGVFPLICLLPGGGLFGGLFGSLFG